MGKVLIIDDDAVWGQLTKRRLEMDGIEADFHLGAFGALNTIRDGGYTLIVLDVRMPGLTGDRIAHTLYHLQGLSLPKVILCSAIDIDELQRLAEHLKSDAFISKSVNQDGLVGLVKKVLGESADEHSAGRTANSMAGCPLCAATARGSEGKETAKATILLVEDHEASRKMLVRRLQRRQISVLVAESGFEAIAVAKDAHPDLILMDMNLPGASGLDTTRTLKGIAETREIPVLALTAHAVLYGKEECLKAGVDDWDSKPIDFPRLLSKIDALLANAH